MENKNKSALSEIQCDLKKNHQMKTDYQTSRRKKVTLRDIQLIDMTNLSRRLLLYRAAMAANQAWPDRLGLLNFFALVEHCLRNAKNPPAMLSKNLFNGYYSCIRSEDEAKAEKQIISLRREGVIDSMP